MKAGLFSQALWKGKAEREEMENREVVEKIIDFLEIQHIRKTPVARLPYGLKKRVELARALAAEPTHPAAGRADGGHERRGKRGHEPLYSGCER